MRTVSFTPCSASARPDRASPSLPAARWATHLAALFVLLLLCLALAAPQRVWAQQQIAVDVAPLVLERADDGVHLSTQLTFELPSSVEEALHKGMAIYFVTEATTLRARWYWYDKQVARANRYFRLSYQPLSRRWRLQTSTVPLTNNGQGVVLGQVYDTLTEALTGVQRISRWRIAGPGALEPDSRHTVEFQFRLDLTQLPRPFQLGVVGQSDWNIQAERSVRLPADMGRVEPTRSEAPKPDAPKPDAAARPDAPGARGEGGGR